MKLDIGTLAGILNAQKRLDRILPVIPCRPGLHKDIEAVTRNLSSKDCSELAEALVSLQEHCHSLNKATHDWEGKPYDEPQHYPACSAPTRKPKVKPEEWDAWTWSQKNQHRLKESGCWEIVRWEVSWNYVTGRKGRVSDQARRYCDDHARQWCKVHEVPLPEELAQNIGKES